MDKVVQKKKNGHAANNLPLDPDILDSQSSWPRCNSLSSCSNDSSVFSSSSHQADIHLINDEQHSNHLSKRNRNSSGSSVSSNMSCVSDKDTKKASVIISSSSVPEGTQPENLARLTSSNASPNNFNRQHETLISNRLNHTDTLKSVLPFRHNLRKNIRKKTCSCDCTATCTTLFVRRYKETTLERETVISSTNVQTFVQKNAAQAIHNVSFDKDFSPNKIDNRKRRSEVEKLYDSLHEIKWAKNFSPDNILKQINIRQAASCSVFGKSSPEKQIAIDCKPSKRQRIEYDQSTSASCIRNSLEKKKSTKSDLKQVTTNLTLRSHRKNGITLEEIMSSNCVNPIENSPLKEFKSHEINPDSSHTLLTKNKHNYLKNCMGSHLKSKFVESSSASNKNCLQKGDEECSVKLFSSTEIATSLPINYLFNLKNEPNKKMNNPDIKSNYSSSFYGIAEEGMRTIDACFQEVGAEVVVSTCIEQDCDIPHLTSASDNISSKRSPVHDNPPVLEPCISLHEHISFQNIECKITPSLYGKSLYCITTSPEFMYAENHVQVNSYVNKGQNQQESTKSIEKLHSNLNNRHRHNLLIKITGKKILNKYLRILRAKTMNRSTEKPGRFERKKEYPCVSPVNNNIAKKNSSGPSLNKISVKRMGRKKNSSFSSSSKTSEKDVKKICPTSERNGEKISSVSSHDCKIINDRVERKKSLSPVSKTSDDISKRNSSVNRSCITATRKENVCNSSIDRTSDVSFDGKKNSPLSSVGKRSCANVTRKDNSSLSLIDKTSNTNVTNKESSSFSPISQTIDTNVAFKSPSKDCSSLSHISVASPISAKTQKLSFKSAGRKAESTETVQSSEEVSFTNHPKSVTINQNSDSLMCTSDKQSLSHVSCSSRNVMNRSVSVQTSINVLPVQHAPVASASHMPLNFVVKEKSDIPCPIRPVSFTCFYHSIRVSRENSYVQVQLKINRGCSTFLTVESLSEMKDIINRANQDDGCHSVILNGVGDSFCLGLDLLPLLGPQKMKASTDIAVAVKEFIETLSNSKKPFVAVANGSAFGLGMTILNHADICIASDAANFCLPQTSLGYFPEGGATLTLSQAVGSTVATDLILRSRKITAQEAKDIGLITEIMEAKRLPIDLVSRVKVLVKNSLPGMETAKAMLKMRLHLDLLMVLENEVKLLPKVWLSQPCQEAMRNPMHKWLWGE
ncbi:chromodomain Y-like protein [Trichonephila inaurata madagascariensis]|uniref:Chromodomain Y-like protein n=1 Tax=Trichonephila inaurata madagascariensis TaxID=2747483 RepID=A0A8X6X2B6_9ARAC|nr:chromodomain Y-like protein [Trichonephila inaurata madagascariensis]